MATIMRHRKLFPAGNNSINGTDCSDLYNCDPFLYYSQPPPPPSPPLPLPSPLAVPNESDQNHGVPASVIVLVALFASLLILVGYYVVVSKSCLGLCRARNNNNDEEASAAPLSQSDGGEGEFLEENRVDHPIWFITTVGLQQSIINSITVCKYKKGEGLIEGNDCSVCLNQFREDETLRLLPKCSHAFHIPCIDPWLRSHTNCPLCRAHIVSDGIGSNLAGAPPSAPANQNRDSLRTIEETQMGISEVDHSQMGHNRFRAGAEEYHDEGGEAVLQGDRDERRVLKEVAMNSNGQNDNDEIFESEVRLKRRSVSMDSSSAAANKIWDLKRLFLAEREERNPNTQFESTDQKQDDGYSRMIRVIKRHPSMAEYLRVSPVAMKRSFSCEGRFLSSRQNLRLNSLLLPL